MLIAQLDETHKLEENLEGKWEIDLSKLNEKINSLTSAQVIILMEDIHRFWNTGKYGEVEKFTESYKAE